MNPIHHPKRGLLVATLATMMLACVALACWPRPAAAAPMPSPAWEVKVVAQPSVFSPSDTAACEEHASATFGEQLLPCDGYTVIARNSGAAPSVGPVTITDALPVEGEAAVHVAGIELQHGGFGPNQMECPEAPLTLTVSCTYAEPIPPDGVLAMRVNVTTPGGPTEALDKATVEGGGASATAATTKTPLAGSALPFGFADYSMSADSSTGASDTQAGSHPYELTTSLDFTTHLEPEPNGGVGDGPTEEPRDIVAYLPPGAVGDPQALEACPEASFLASNHQTACPKGSVAGLVTADLRNAYITSGVVADSTSSIYNLEPAPGYAAEFGFTLLGQPLVMYATAVWHDGQYSLRVSTTSLPAEPLLGLSITFFGNPSEKSRSGPPSQAFLRNPTECSSGPLSSRIEADSTEEPHRWATAEAITYPAITECNRLQFNPQITVTPETTAADTPAGYEVALKVPQQDLVALSATPDLKNATVTLPSGTSLSPAGANGLAGCQESGPEGIDFPHGTMHPDEAGEGEEIGADGLSRLAPGHCPEASQVGTVEIVTPLLSSPLQGHVDIAQPKCGGDGQAACTQASSTNGELFGLYLEAAGSGVIVKLKGTVSADPATGRLTTHFDENPQLPFSELKLKLNGGPRAPLANAQSCGEAQTTSILEPWSAEPEASATAFSSFFVTGCQNPMPFSPAFAAGTITPIAGAFTPFTMTLSRKDGDRILAGVSLTMPPGVAGLVSKVPLCPEPQASLGTCPAASRIGTVNAAAGAGSEPLWLSGPVYLTGPYKGAPFGLSIVVPAKAGPFNLGDVIERAAINLDPHTAQVTVTSDPLPQIRDGVPFRLKTVNVTVDRPEFMFNPTNCSQLHVTGTVSGDMPDGSAGATAPVSTPFAVAGCRNLPFKPAFSALTNAKHTRFGGDSLHVVIKSAQGQVNLKEVHVELPKVLPSRLSTLNLACPEATFAANPAACPAGSRVGVVTAQTPILSVPLTGPAYFVSHGGAKFPELIFVLQGEGVTVQLNGETFISSKGITSSTFKTIPDVPVSRVDVVLPAGKDSVLAGEGDLCAHPLYMPTTLTGQNGAVIKERTKIAVSGCKPAIRVLRHRVRGSKATILVQVPSAGTLVATGKGIKRSVKRAPKAKIVTIAVTLTSRDQRILAKHPHQHINAKITLRFRRKHGAPLTAHVKLLMG